MPRRRHSARTCYAGRQKQPDLNADIKSTLGVRQMRSQARRRAAELEGNAGDADEAAPNVLFVTAVTSFGGGIWFMERFPREANTTLSSAPRAPGALAVCLPRATWSEPQWTGTRMCRRRQSSGNQAHLRPPRNVGSKLATAFKRRIRSRPMRGRTLHGSRSRSVGLRWPTA